MTDQPKILIVDDEPDILLMMRVNLESEGFVTVLAADGETALSRVEDEQPDVVLLDVMMPVLDGWGVLEALGRRGDRTATIVVSAKAAAADLARAYQLGACDYVTKPFSIEHLVATIRDVLSRSDDEREQRRRSALAELGVEVT
ncbi:MAG TPA: response regulator transcription factor [Acidimicrobiia bacterium]|nr:response regulator transcription factor [Acidimicrobiia bacterium]